MSPLSRALTIAEDLVRAEVETADIISGDLLYYDVKFVSSVETSLPPAKGTASTNQSHDSDFSVPEVGMAVEKKDQLILALSREVNFSALVLNLCDTNLTKNQKQVYLGALAGLDFSQSQKEKLEKVLEICKLYLSPGESFEIQMAAIELLAAATAVDQLLHSIRAKVGSLLKRKLAEADLHEGVLDEARDLLVELKLNDPLYEVA